MDVKTSMNAKVETIQVIRSGHNTQGGFGINGLRLRRLSRFHFCVCML